MYIKSMKKTPLILIGLIVFLGFTLMSSYNRLVSQNNAVDNQWAQVETQYQRRFDLIPNLVSSTQAFLKQEQKVFSDIAEARTRYSGAQTVDDQAQAAATVESALSRLLVIIENYPDLKSDQTVARLMDELAGTENRVSVERQRFNDYVAAYNLSIKKLPTSLYAGLLGFTERQYFNSVSEADQAPAVQFDID